MNKYLTDREINEIVRKAEELKEMDDQGTTTRDFMHHYVEVDNPINQYRPFFPDENTSAKLRGGGR